MQKATIEGYQLSPQQSRIWKLRRSASASALHAQCAIRVNGAAGPSALRRALERVIRRHETLRTGFHSLPGMEAPIQVISEEARVAWREVDLRGMEEEERRRALAEVMRSERRLGSEIESGDGAVRALLAAIGEDEQVLVLSMSALIGDAWTLMNLAGELCAACAAEMGEGGNRLGTEDDPLVQHVDYSEWQNELHKEYNAEHAYWRDVARRGDEELKLPLEEKGAEGEYEEGEWEEIEIEDELRRGVERVGRGHEVSEAIVLLACWQLLLWRLTGRSDIVTRNMFDGRRVKQLQGTLGPLAKFVPVQSHLEANFLFSEVLSFIDETVRNAYTRQDYYVWEEDGPDLQSGAFASALPIGFEYQSWPSSHSGSALSFSLLDVFSSSDLFKLRLCLAASTGFLRARFFFDSGRFSRAAIRLLASQFVSLLRSVVGSPRALIGDLEVLGEQERGLLLSQSERQSRPYPTELPLELFEQWAARIPKEIAVECGDRRLSFGELDRLARAVARRLREMGAGPDQRVALLLERSVEMVAAALGVWKAGAAYAPLDPSQPETRMIGMIKDSGAVATLSSRKVMGTVNLSLSGVPTLLVEDIEKMRSEWEEWPEEAAPRRVSGEDLAYLIYTSATTGQAKGVMVRHSSLANLIWALEEAIYEKQDLRRVSVNAPMAFDASVKQLAQVCRGRTLVIIPEDVRQDPELLVNYLREKEVELLDSTPSQLRALLEAGLEEAATGTGVKGAGGSLRAALIGGEAIDEALWRRLAGGKIACYNVYGPTECTVDATCELIGEGGPYLGSAALGNMEVYLLDEAQRPAPAGVVGELCVGGAGVARGYNGDASKTAEKFVPDWLSGRAGARLYRTGDLARMREDGRIEYVGRRDGQVKIRGYRVELGEIEAALMSHGAARQAVVVARESEDGEKRLVAYVVGAEVESGELRRLLRERLPEYMWPGAIVKLDNMPLTRNGKIDRNALPDPSEYTDSEEEAPAGEQPQTLYHEILIGIWRQALGVSRVGIDDSFFDLGGHSLLATQLMSRIRDAFGVEVALRTLFDRPTVRRLGEAVEEAVRAGQGVAAPPLVRANRERELPLSFAQQRLWFLDQLEPGYAYYNCPAAVRMKGRLDVDALERTLWEVMRRHEALRTRFETVNGQPVQVIEDAPSLNLRIVDLQQLPEAEHEIEARRIAREDTRLPFDLRRCPLVRATLLNLAEEDHVVIFTMHHIVSDAWSKKVLVREVAALYEAFSQGRPSPLPELPIQYADYAVWQRDWLQGEALEKQLAYWRELLGGKPPSLELPTDRPRPARPRGEGAHRLFVLPDDLTKSLKGLCQRTGATMFMVMLAAFQTFLQRYTDQDDIVIGADIANRARGETEKLIGFFINMMVMRADLSDNPTFLTLLKRVREMAVNAYSYQDLPFDKLVEELQPERSLNQSPLFRVVLMVENTPEAVLEIPGLTVSEFQFDHGIVRFDLTLMLSEFAGAVRGYWGYSSELFEESTIEQMHRRFTTLLHSVVADPDARLRDLEMFNEDEKQQQELGKKQRQILNTNKLKVAKRKSVSVSSELHDTAGKL